MSARGVPDGSSALFTEALVAPGVQPLVDNQQWRDRGLALRLNPEAIAARRASRTAFERLDAHAVAQLARGAFPTAIEQKAAGPPQLASGERIARYLDANAAQLDLGGGRRAVVESLTPLARRGASGSFVPVDLSLRDSGGAFTPLSSAADVRIPKSLDAGVELMNAGISLTPVDAAGTPLRGAGGLDGSTVLYANTQTDTDTAVKPTATGFETYSMLRSIDSPQQLSYRVGLPQGASLSLAKDGSESALVRVDGTTIATLSAPAALDALGNSVPVSVGVSGDTLRLGVSHRSGDYAYPILVDPQVADTQLMVVTSPLYHPSNWKFGTNNSSAFFPNEEVGVGISDFNNGGASYTPPEQHGAIAYETQGSSKIYKFVSKTSAVNAASDMANSLVILSAKAKEAIESLPTNYAATSHTVCVEATCPTTAGNETNAAEFLQSALKTGNKFNSTISSAEVFINQSALPTVSFDTTDKTLSGYPGGSNALYGAGWGNHNTYVGVKSADTGLGISEYSFKSPGHETWGRTESYLTSSSSICKGLQCESSEAPNWSVSGLPDGEDTVEATVSNAAGGKATASTTVKVDDTPPHELVVTGMPAENEFSDSQNQVKLKATVADGSGTTKSSGIASIALYIDGQQIGSPSGSCPLGPCSASGEFTVTPDNFGAGKHALAIWATDGAGNAVKQEYTITVHHAEPMALSPGSVDPVTGEFDLAATDVSISAPQDTLTVSRTYNSRHLSHGSEGPLGNAWTMNVGDQQSLIRLANGSMQLSGAGGEPTTFLSSGGGNFSPPAGDGTLSLKEQVVGGKAQFVLGSNGSSTTFAIPSGGSGNVWMPTISAGAGGTNATTFAYQTVGGITEPTEVLAPVPAGVACGTEPKELKRGCRALTFNYATSTTATGEAPAEWGDYSGHLTRVYFTAWDPEKAEMATTTIAQYSYDKQGRMRAEWDPRISPALKTTYGYDSEGHVTALSIAGEQPYLMTYGTWEGDSNTGRLLSVTRPAASTALGNGEAAANTASPTLSTASPVVGTALSVSSTGTWSHSPLSYGYEWERCDTSGANCVLIPGAVNKEYTPVYSDEMHTLVAVVLATNAGGTVTASSTATSVVPYTASPSYSSAFGTAGAGNGQLKVPVGVAVELKNESVLVADSGNNRAQRFNSSGSYVSQFGTVGSGNGQFKEPTGIATGPLVLGEVAHENIYVTDTANNRVEDFYGIEYIWQFGSAGTGNGQYKAPAGVAVSPLNNNEYIADSANNRIEEIGLLGSYVTQFGSVGSGNGQLKEPKGVAVDASGNVWVADKGNNRIEEFTSSGSYVRQAGSEGTGNGQLKAPQGVAVDAGGNVWVADTGNNRIEEFGATGVYMSKGGSEGTGNGQFKEPRGIAVDPKGNVYVTDAGNSRVEKWTPGTLPADVPQPAATPPSLATSAITTVDYHVPVSGTGAPYAMGSADVAKWAQTDVPVDATAIFPPDEPMGWPAQNYKRATIEYLDNADRTVNLATPSGGISTTEYNSYHDSVRSLSPVNRALALKEGAKSAEVSQLLDTQSTYGSEGSELLSVLGPQHSVKLKSGSQVLAREHSQYYYDEGAPSGGPYRLVTKLTTGAQIAGEPEADVRTTTTSYSGENNLGWILREPTSTTRDPGALNLIHTTVYDPVSGAVTETRDPGAGAEPAGSYAFRTAFGTKGTGTGQFKGPVGTAVDASGNVWSTDSGNDRVEEFSPTGTFMAAYGSAGTGNGQYSFPSAIAVNTSSGNVYIADEGNNRLQELTSEGKFIRVIGGEGKESGQFEHPSGIAIDSSGNLWVADFFNSRVQELNSEGKWLRTIGAKGKENGQFEHAAGVALSGGNVYITDYGNNRVEEFTTGGAYLAKFGSPGAGNGQFENPSGIATEPTSGNLYVTDEAHGRIDVFSASGTFVEAIGSEGWHTGQFLDPDGISFAPSGMLYVADYGNNRIQRWLSSTAEVYSSQFGTAGAGNGQLSKPGAIARDSAGNVWIADSENNRVEEFSAEGAYVQKFGTSGTGNGQFKKPEGITIDSSGNVWVADSGNSRIQEFNSKGGYLSQFGSAGSFPGQFFDPTGIAYSVKEHLLYIADTGNSRIQLFTTSGSFESVIGSGGSGNGQFSKPEGIALDASGNVWVADSGNNRIEEFSNEGAYVQKFGTSGSGNGQLSKPEGLALDSEGNVWVADGGNSRVEEFTSAGAYVRQFGTKGSGELQMSTPAGLVLDSSNDVYVLDTANARVQKWIPSNLVHESQGNGGTHGSQTIYYTAGVNALVAGCGEHPEWAGLACETRPAEQPETEGLPELPVTSVTYNIWQEAATTVETAGEATRTATDTYDSAGRLVTSGVKATTGTATPAVSKEYNSETGALVKESVTVEGKTRRLTSVFNTLGQMTSYTDADENTATYTYDLDGRTEKTNDGKGTQTFAYDATTGYVAKLVDSAAGTFTASFDVEGNATTVSYPNGMNVTHSYDTTGQETGVEYVKTTHCTTGCTWFSDTIVPSISSQWLSQTSTFSSQNYSYDAIGRLTQVQDTPTGQGCTTRLYAYDMETNRTSMTSRVPGVGGKCAAEGGTTESHSYDTANRLVDSGTGYDAFGDVTKLPAADAGGAEVTSTYYADGTLGSQTQKGQTIGYYLDPAGRTRETIGTGTSNSTLISHYAGGSDSPAWTVDLEGKWTRNIAGMDGSLVATQSNGEAPALEIENLHGDIVATASLSETATALASTNDTTEYGVPRTSSPPKYSWLGGSEVATEMPSGIIAMGARSYVPQLGGFLQPDPVPGGSANAYGYTFGDPVNSSDPSGEMGEGLSGWLEEANGGISEEIVAREAAREAAARAEAEAKAAAAAAAAGGGDIVEVLSIGGMIGGGPIAGAAELHLQVDGACNATVEIEQQHKHNGWVQVFGWWQCTIPIVGTTTLFAVGKGKHLFTKVGEHHYKVEEPIDSDKVDEHYSKVPGVPGHRAITFCITWFAVNGDTAEACGGANPNLLKGKKK